MKKSKLLLYSLGVITFLMLSLSGFAQQKTISGTVLDAKRDSALGGVTVKVKNTQITTITKPDGTFEITVPKNNSILVVSSSSYESQELPVNLQTTFTINLKPSVIGLDDVVVVGYGTQKKATLTGAVVQVSGAEVARMPATNVSNSLAGMLSGVFVQTGSAEPGMDGSSINIRGLNTFGNASPLVVVDGVPGRSLDRIDPNTIENISVLKDASAGIYGAQAANGVILVTTKRGKTGKASVGFSFNWGQGQPTTVPKMTNSYQYATLLNEIDKYAGHPDRYSSNDLKLYQNGSDPLGHPNTDWYNQVFKNWSNQHSYNLTLNGGSEDFRYFISGNSIFQDGFYNKSANNYQQQNVTINLDGKINKYVSLTANIMGRGGNLNAPSTPSDGIFESTSRSKPMDQAYWPNGLPGPGVEGGYNPVLMVTDQMGYNNTKEYTLNSNFGLKIDFPWVAGLSMNLMAALDETFRYDKLWQIPWNTYSWDGTSVEANGDPTLVKSSYGPGGTLDPKLTQNESRMQNLLTTAQLNYKTKIGQNQSFGFFAGVEKIKGESAGLYGYRRYFISTAIDELSFGGPVDRNTFGASAVSHRLNYFGRVNYTALNRFLVEFQWRYQGSYIFSKENRYGFFPGGSLGYILSEEKFWKTNFGNKISFFKIRASIGKTGNDLVAPYQYLASYYRGGLDMITSGSNETAIYENVAPNPNATWESVTQKDLGIDLRFLNNAFSLTVDYFNNKRSDILAPKNAAVPASAGLNLPNENIGEVQTKGFDFDIAYKSRPNGNKLNYQISFNGVYSKNKLNYWAENPGAPAYQKAEGAPLFAELYYVSLGIFKDQAAVDKYPHWDGARAGDVIFEDVNGDGVINDLDKVRRNKSNFPTTSGGITINLQYKAFDFTTRIQGAAGAERYIFGYAGEVGNYFQDFYDNRWTEANPNASGPRTYNRNNEYWATSDDWSHQSTQFLYSTDYIRLKIIELGYNVDLNKVGIKNLRFYMSAYNLLTYAPNLPKGFDPEQSQLRGFAYPQQKIINFGLSVKF